MSLGPPLRRLLRMNNGIGFLLRVTDVEKQPLRSMGFVSVIIVADDLRAGAPTPVPLVPADEQPHNGPSKPRGRSSLPRDTE